MAPITRQRSGLRSASTSSGTSRPTKASASAKQPTVRTLLKSSKVSKPASTKSKTKTTSEAGAIRSVAKSLSVAGKVKVEDAPSEKDRPVEADKTNVHLLVPATGGVGEKLVHPAPEINAKKEHKELDTLGLTADNVLERAIAHILTHAPQMKPLIDAHPCTPFSSAGMQDVLDPFQSLASGIISQQVSGAAARSIKKKFVALFNPDAPEGEGKFPTPEQVLKTDVPTLRAAGLSQRKAEYVQSLADAFVKDEVNADLFMTSSNEEITEKLTKIRGIGVWSVEMFLLFHLRRLDVFSTGDLGIQRGMAVLAGKNVKALKNTGKGKWKYMGEKDMIEMAEKFRPYRSIFMWYMWKMSDTEVEAMAAASKAKEKANGKGKKGKKEEGKEESEIEPDEE